MFDYTDPTKTGLLKTEGALASYQREVHVFYRDFARAPGSGFTLLDAFDELTSGGQRQLDQVTWKAFPRSALASHLDIDTKRTQLQDEYVEWRVERSAQGKVTRVTFTTEFTEYWAAFAAVGVTALRKAIQAVNPDANPTDIELFGNGFNPAQATAAARARQFVKQAPANPWVNGNKDILFLIHRSSTLSALLNLVNACAIPQTQLAPGDVCGTVSNACVKERNSDPSVCGAAQSLVTAQRALSLEDPVGVEILQLDGVWKIGGNQVDINDAATNQGAWIISRNGRRGVLDVAKGVTAGDQEIVSGAQVATSLVVGATVVSAPENTLPAWARTGQESTRAIV